MKEEVTRKGMAGEIPVYCSFDKIVPWEEVKPNPRNPNQHPEAQIELLAKVIKGQGWRAPVTVSTRSGLIVRGHGRYMAAEILGCPVPVDYQHYGSDDEELADLIADNRLAELSEIDNKMLAELFSEIDTDSLPVEMTGYDGEEIADIMSALTASVKKDVELSEEYTKKVPRIQYVVTGDTPEVSELMDGIKARELLRDIETETNITEEEREFLRMAAYRHLVFDYHNIAEYYAAASPAMQRLMEDSALVIVDIGDAIENGYAKLKSSILDMVEQEREQ